MNAESSAGEQVDNRFRLEKEVREWASSRLLGDGVAETIVGWLDRQREITKSVMDHVVKAQGNIIQEREKRICELTDQVDELTNAHKKLIAEKAGLEDENMALVEAVKHAEERAKSLEEKLERRCTHYDAERHRCTVYDEPTAEDPSSAEDLSSKDAVELMRKCAEQAHGMGKLRKALGIECTEGWQMRCLDMLADMVERDWMRLPVDSEGVPIRVGDLIEFGEKGERLEVTHFGWTSHGDPTIAYRRPNGTLDCSCIGTECRHAKPDTVESLLKGCYAEISNHLGEGRMGEIVEDYAERIRKAVER